ncbi:Flagellar basal-body rod protein FlgB [hydrothermal vent metagenome]|uniref:Flagellar basal-body rod protein FlgB n=1 Tax=hydrothermal vent metagenome TaxID=652676 RepID=A0A3B0XLQ3_9ZZZZ
MLYEDELMVVNFNNAFGINDDALLLFERRTQLLSENIANADTPGFKARDIDFDQVLQNTRTETLKMTTTRKNHISLSTQAFSGDVRYREVEQSAADGNTVDLQREKAAFAENSMRYQTTMNIMSRKISGLKTAFRGE